MHGSMAGKCSNGGVPQGNNRGKGGVLEGYANSAAAAPRDDTGTLVSDGSRVPDGYIDQMAMLKLGYGAHRIHKGCTDMHKRTNGRMTRVH